jgi:hypothetical protein
MSFPVAGIHTLSLRRKEVPFQGITGKRRADKAHGQNQKQFAFARHGFNSPALLWMIFAAKSFLSG